MDKLDDIRDLLNENAKLDIAQITKELNDNSPDKIGKLALKKEIEERQRIANDRRDTCIPMINKPIHIYRQTVNGKDVIGFSKAYNLAKGDPLENIAK